MNPVDRTSTIPALPNQGGQANVSGLRRLWLIEARHLLGLTDPRTVPGFISANWLLSPTALQLTEDARIQAFKFAADRGDYQQKASVGVQGVLFEQALTLVVPKDHMTTALVVQRMTGRKWIAIYQDANGQRKVIGTPRQPLRFTADLKASPNGYLFSWTTATRQPAYFFNDDGLLLGQTDADFSSGFSYDFYS